MKDFAEGIALITEQANIIEAARAEQVRIKREMVERFSPVKVGDIVMSNSGFSHIGKKMRIDTITVQTKSSFRGEVGFVATGKVLKKDGLPGLNTAEYHVAP